MNDFVRLTGIWDDICPFQIMTITDDQNGLTLEIEDNRTGEKKGRFRFTAHHAYRKGLSQMFETSRMAGCG